MGADARGANGSADGSRVQLLNDTAGCWPWTVLEDLPVKVAGGS